MFARLRSLSVLPIGAITFAFITGCAPGDAEQVSVESFDAASNRGQAFIQDESSNPNILNVAIRSADHTTLVAAVQAAELENVLVNAGPLTVFAPTNAAFDALPPGTLEDLLKPENKQTLANIITSHAAPGKYTIDKLPDGVDLYMATGHYLKVEVRDGDTYVNGAKILGSIEATNGVVHVIDVVFLVAAG